MTLAVMKIWTVLLKKEKKKEKTSKNKKGVKTVTKINTNKSTGGYSQGTFPSVNRQIFSAESAVQMPQLQPNQWPVFQLWPESSLSLNARSPESETQFRGEKVNGNRRGAIYTSSSFSSMLGIPLEIGNSRPDSGHCRQPSITSTYNATDKKSPLGGTIVQIPHTLPRS